MPSGRKVEIYNTRERLVSSDHNREQAFAADDTAEEARKLLSTAMILDAGPVEAEVDTVADPIEGHIMGGLLVEPQQGTDDLFVLSGVVYLVDPDGQAGSSDPNPPSPDDNPFKYVRSDGIQTGGTLQLTANLAGSDRIDIVECRRVPIQVDESGNRDIFDPSTGLFSPVSVDKVQRSELEFRVRLGTAGAGLPATAQGWLPLCVVNVPAGTTSPVVDDATFWDVRPLVTDRARPPFNQTRTFSKAFHPTAFIDGATNPTVVHNLTGQLEGENNQYVAGGVLRSGVPGTGDGDAIDILDVRNQDGAVAFVNFPWFLWALFPGGLPRWVRYTEGAPRLPGPFRGIPVVSQVGPISLSHSTPLVPIALPASTGLSATAAFGTCLMAGHTISGSAIPAAGTVKHGVYKVNGPGVAASQGAATQLVEPGSAVEAWWNISNGGALGYPPNARSIIARISFLLTDAAVTSAEVSFEIDMLTAIDTASTFATAGGTIHVARESRSSFTDGSGNSDQMVVTAEFPIHEDWPIGTHTAPSTPSLPDQRIGIRVVANTGVAWVFTVEALDIIGWRLSGV